MKAYNVISWTTLALYFVGIAVVAGMFFVMGTNIFHDGAFRIIVTLLVGGLPILLSYGIAEWLFYIK